MAVTIIKEGQLPEEKIFETICSNCQTHFTFARKDAKSHSDQRDGDWLEIACPFCSKRVVVYPK